MSNRNVLLALLAGVAAGSLLGILFAPDKGSVTRKKITKKGEEFAEGLGDKFNEFLTDAKEKFDQVKDDVTAAAENFKTKAEGKVENAEKSVI